MKFGNAFRSFCFLAAAILMDPSTGRGANLDKTLRLISEASKNVSFSGVLTQLRLTATGDTLRVSQRLVHQRPDLDRIDVLEPNARPGVVVIRTHGDVFRREVIGDSLFYSHRSQLGPDILDMGLDFSRLDLLRANYELVLSDAPSLLGRPTALLTISPRHPRRRPKKTWIDTQTGIVLRTEDRDESGTLAEAVFFTTLQINQQIDPLLFETTEWKYRATEVNEGLACGSYTEVQREAGFPLSAPIYLPRGFILERLRVLRFAGQRMVHFSYTDGLAQLSLFERVAGVTDSAAQVWPGGLPVVRGGIQVWKRAPYTILRRSDGGKISTVVSTLEESESMNLIQSLCVLQAQKNEPAPTNRAPMDSQRHGRACVGCWMDSLASSFRDMRQNKLRVLPRYSSPVLVCVAVSPDSLPLSQNLILQA